MHKAWMRIAALVALLAAVGIVIAYRDHIDAAVLEEWVRRAGPAAPLIFMVVYALGAVLFVPGSVLTLAGGALFGPVLGTLYNLTGATAGATLAFLVSRYLASGWVARRSGGRLKQLIAGVENEGWRFVAFTRLVPLFPFNLLNYALGLTRIRLSHYVIATFVCMLPGALAYTYLGYAGREAVAGSEGVIQKGLLALALLAVVAFLPRFIARLRQRPMMDTAELKRRLDDGEDLLVLDVRSGDEYHGEMGHIAGAVNVPVEDLRRRLDELAGRAAQPVAIVCRTDRRSAKAAQLLAQKGFADVQVVRGGMIRWRDAGYDVEGATHAGGASA